MSEQNTIHTNNEEKKITAKDLFKIRDFRLLWLGQIVSNFGDSMTSLALLLLVNHLTGSTAALATMAIILAIPSLTFGLVAGVYVDRLDRKKIMIVSDLLRGLFVLGFIFVDTAEKVWLLYLIGFIQATIATFFRPARAGALLPNIVPAKGLLAANSISETSRIIFGVLGTGAAGFLIGSFDGFWEVFAIDAFTFFISLAMIAMIAFKAPKVEKVEAISVKQIYGELVSGLKVTFGSRILSGAIISFAVTMLGLGAVNILLVPMIVNDLQLSETWFAAIEFSQTAGMILAGSLVAILAARFKSTQILPVALLGLGVTVALFSLTGAVWQLLAIMFLAGLCITPIQASGSTIIQTFVPDNLRGRTGSANNALITTAQLVSMGLAGVLADTMGARNVFIIGGAVVALAGVAAAIIFRGVDETAPITSPEIAHVESAIPAESI